MQVLFLAAFSHNPNQEQETVHVLYLIEEVQVDQQDIDKESVHKKMQTEEYSMCVECVPCIVEYDERNVERGHSDQFMEVQ